MNAAVDQFVPGALVHVRERDWIVEPGSVAPLLKLRPLAGSDEDVVLVHTGLEPEVTSANFPPPDPAHESGQVEAVLLADALRMALRRGAGPFRSFGNIAVEPLTYQLVPLLMALRFDPVRLLIADDVGIGKTIEAALVVRELFDRGEIRRVTVLCPPHLVEQWVAELGERFQLNAAAVTASSVARLERGLPVGKSVFEEYPVTVVSLDYIKSERHRHDFIRACPECVVVDEAHTCVSTGRNRPIGKISLPRADPVAIQSRPLFAYLLACCATCSGQQILCPPAHPAASPNTVTRSRGLLVGRACRWSLRHTTSRLINGITASATMVVSAAPLACCRIT